MSLPSSTADADWSTPEEPPEQPRNGTDPGWPTPEEPLEEPHNGEGEPWQESRAAEDQNRSEEEPVPDTEETNTPPRPQRHYPPRLCRICLESVLPTYEPGRAGIGAFLDPAPRVSYISSDPQAGRLIRPCKCKGSSRYVHEGCLQLWRHADRKYARRNFWECPTCKFRYQLDRMRWARWISSRITQVLLTIMIMVVAIFIFGFVADPIMEIFLGPLDPDELALEEIPEELLEIYNEAPWTIHFLKGMASVGLLGFVKLLLLSPFGAWNLRQTGLLRYSGQRGTGRDRASGITFALVLSGLFTIIAVVWRWVRQWSRSMLEKAGERVADVQGADDDFEEEPVVNPSVPQTSTSPDAETRKTQ